MLKKYKYRVTFQHECHFDFRSTTLFAFSEADAIREVESNYSLGDWGIISVEMVWS